jgi:hypothetical protein
VAYFYGELFGYTKEIISTIEDHSKMFGASLEGVSIEFTRESERARAILKCRSRVGIGEIKYRH